MQLVKMISSAQHQNIIRESLISEKKLILTDILVSCNEAANE